MSDELDLEAIKAREKNATAGPWTKEWVNSLGVTCRAYAVPGVEWTDECWDNDQRFIAYARKDIPALIAEVERLRTPQVGSWDWAFGQMKAGMWIANESLVQAECSIGLQGAVFQLRTRHNKLVPLNFDLTDFERTDWQIAGQDS